MKGKRYSTEDKIRILREADGGKNIVELCREKNLFARSISTERDSTNSRKNQALS